MAPSRPSEETKRPSTVNRNSTIDDFPAASGTGASHVPQYSTSSSAETLSKRPSTTSQPKSKRLINLENIIMIEESIVKISDSL